MGGHGWLGVIHSGPMTPAISEAPRPLSRPGVPMPLLGDRSLFPDLTARAFLAHAAISPASLATTRAAEGFLKDVSRLGVAAFPIWAAQRERLRGLLSAHFDCDAASIALTPGCTKGITDLALALPLKERDVIVCYRGEFPANVIPFQLAAERRGARVDFLDVPPPTSEGLRDRIVSDLAERLSAPDAPRFVATSGVQFQTGLRMPLLEMMEVCRAKKVRLFVDGIQGAGVVPWSLRQLGIDAFFSGSHKWMLGLEGAGFAYLSPDLMGELDPVTAGWLSFPEAENFLFRGPGHLRYDRELYTTPRVFEGSTMGSIVYAAMEGGVEVLSHLGAQAIYDHIQGYHDEIEPRLVDLGFESLRAKDRALRSGLLSFRPKNGVDAPSLAAALREHGVTISIPDGLVRLAPHFANSLDEVPLVVSAFKQALSSL